MPFCSRRLQQREMCQHSRTCRGGICTAHISVMASGRWAGIAVRPRPRQSTMLLLQEHMGGQEPDARLHGWTKALPL